MYQYENIRDITLRTANRGTTDKRSGSQEAVAQYCYIISLRHQIQERHFKENLHNMESEQFESQH